MKEMKSDKVVNVKLLLAETVRDHIEEKGPLCEEDELISLRDDLKADENEEIRDVFDV